MAGDLAGARAALEESPTLEIMNGAATDEKATWRQTVPMSQARTWGGPRRSSGASVLMAAL